jgi:hypothetical protein
MPVRYYTTADQEAALAKIYANSLTAKQAEIDSQEKRTGRIQKFTARAHVSKPPRVFDVNGPLIILDGLGSCPTEPLTGGACYTTDPSFDDKIAAFLQAHVAYRVIFYPDGRYGPTVGYCSTGLPATFISDDDTETLHAEDDDKYELLCG